MENPMSTKHSRAHCLEEEPALQRKVCPFLTLAACAAVALVTGTARAQAPTLAGRWAASPMRVDWNIGDWGKTCGPRPSGGGSAGGTVTVSVSGAELRMSGAGRTYSTTECWEHYPGLARISHSSGARSWRNVCKTSAGDPRQATVITTITATDERIHFDETGQYQFVLEGQNCTASARRTRVLTLVQREGEVAPAPAASAQPSAKPVKPAQAARCATKGLPERLEVRPSRKLIRAGESFEFRAAVVDRAGCPLGIVPVWRVVSGGEAVELTGPGRIRVREGAQEAEARLQASVGDRSVGVLVEVVSRERYDAVLRQGTFNAEGESAEAAVARIATRSIGTRSSVAQEQARGQKYLFVAVIGTLALLFGMAGLLFMQRSRRQHAVALATPPTKAEPAPTPSRATGKICPTCREEFPPNAEFCAFDGNRLLPFTQETGVGPTGGVCPVCGQGYDPGVSVCPKHNEQLIPAPVHAERLKVLSLSRRICPVCGTQFPGDSQFCGKCGAALVPVN